MPEGIGSLRDVPPSTPDSGGELEPSNCQDWGCSPGLRGHASASQDQPWDSVPPSWDLPDKPYNKMTERRAGRARSKGTRPVRGQLFREASGAQGGAEDTFGSREVSTPAIAEQTMGSWGHCDELASAIREGSRAPGARAGAQMSRETGLCSLLGGPELYALMRTFLSGNSGLCPI